MEFEEIRLLKQSEKSTVLLIREKNEGQLFVRKILGGRHDIYEMLQNCSHPYLPKVYEVVISDDTTSVLEEYIDGQSLGKSAPAEKLICGAINELCSVLQFLHEKGIIHRDIKPSNILLANDGHIRLIDFDAARSIKDNVEQDTKLLGTRGYAPPEQYGFAQTDARADIYSLGVTFAQLLGEKANRVRYKRIIKKCTDWNPDKRYQSVKQVQRALILSSRYNWYLVAAFVTACILGVVIYNNLPQPEERQASSNQIQEQPKTAQEQPQLPKTTENELKQSLVEEVQTPSSQRQTKEQPKTAQEQPQLPKTTEGASKQSPPQREKRIVLTDVIQAPFNTINSSPIHLISGEWKIDNPPTKADATLYKDNQSIAKVRLFEDGKSDIRAKKIQVWSSPAIASEYIQVSDYLELDMSKDEVFAAVEKAKQYPILPQPGMIFVNQATDDYSGKKYDVVNLLYEHYDINYYFRPDMTIVEVKPYLKKRSH